MDSSDWLAERFEEHRGELRAVAYRMLGSLSEADDAVQEAWLRLSRADTSEVQNLGAWLTTVVGRVCLNMLSARTTRRENPLGPHVPDPVISRAGDTDPKQQALLADSVGLALLVVLEMLPPAERLAFVLHDMFAVPFARRPGPPPPPRPARPRRLTASAGGPARGGPARGAQCRVPRSAVARWTAALKSAASSCPPSRAPARAVTTACPSAGSWAEHSRRSIPACAASTARCP